MGQNASFGNMNPFMNMGSMGMGMGGLPGMAMPMGLSNVSNAAQFH